MITYIFALFNTAAVAAPAPGCDFALGRALSAHGRDEIARELGALGPGASVEWISAAWATLPRGGSAGDHVPAFVTTVLRDDLARRGYRLSLHLVPRGTLPAAGDPVFGFSSRRWSGLPADHLRVEHVPYVRVTAE